MNLGTKVTFPRSEPIVDDEGTLHRTDTWTQEGEVIRIHPDGRIGVSWDDRHWGPSRGTFAPHEVMTASDAATFIREVEDRKYRERMAEESARIRIRLEEEDKDRLAAMRARLEEDKRLYTRD